MYIFNTARDQDKYLNTDKKTICQYVNTDQYQKSNKPLNTASFSIE